MTPGTLFWILMLLWLLFGFWWNWGNRGLIGGGLLLFILLVLLGWHDFGPPIIGH